MIKVEEVFQSSFQGALFSGKERPQNGGRVWKWAGETSWGGYNTKECTNDPHTISIIARVHIKLLYCFRWDNLPSQKWTLLSPNFRSLHKSSRSVHFILRANFVIYSRMFSTFPNLILLGNDVNCKLFLSL